MLESEIYATALSKKNFSTFGQVIQADGSSSFWINNNKCERFDALAEIDVTLSTGGPVISIFRSKPYEVPVKLSVFERHPFGSQAFFPLHSDPFLIIIANDKDGMPYKPKAFLTNGNQGVNIGKNVWHGALTPIIKECEFLVVDRSDPKTNLELFELSKPIAVFPKEKKV